MSGIEIHTVQPVDTKFCIDVYRVPETGFAGLSNTLYNTENDFKQHIM